VSGGRAPQLNFPITDEMIETAIPKDSAHCMIADGLRAALPHAQQISVDLATIRYTDPRTGRRYIYLTPTPAQVALLDFDQGSKPKPFTVKAHAAQILLTSAGPKKAGDPKKKAEPEASPSVPESVAATANPSVSGTPSDPAETASPSLSETSADEAGPSLSETPKPTRTPATLIPNPAGGGTVPIKFGGNPPPLGALARGVGTGKTGPKYRTGRKRGFGLRVMGH
jgi:hypothetical protein